MLAVALAGPGAGAAFAPTGAVGSIGRGRRDRFSDAGIDESSGLVVRGDRLFTVNDSGDGPVLYAVDLATGETVAVTTYADQDPDDVEALAPGPHGTVWVGDIGDNRRAAPGRSAVHRVRPAARGDGSVDAVGYDCATPTARTTPRRCWSTPRPVGCSS